MKILSSIILALVFSHSALAQEPLDCNNPSSTIAINQCMLQKLVASEKVLATYLLSSLERYATDTVSVSSIKKSQAVWLNYREAHCGAVFDIWRDGTIRTAMTLDCKLALTAQRTKVLWQSYLTYMDSTPSLLPEPKQ